LERIINLIWKILKYKILIYRGFFSWFILSVGNFKCLSRDPFPRFYYSALYLYPLFYFCFFCCVGAREERTIIYNLFAVTAYFVFSFYSDGVLGGLLGSRWGFFEWIYRFLRNLRLGFKFLHLHSIWAADCV
jgi:hypothetical protein